ncbi:patatin [Hypericibacter terrae]|uniref:Patatin n=1 Tax=Hypericibacter terrae TaxID=2602015 RepID=A0A5J6MEM8_9PROT|nr:CBASS cGAMP-activated phospholipase [Hypericibacter terrae]QEX15918.1 patatin [Hypericibacter terrae]
MPFQILSISGGGYLGLYSIAVLASLEQSIGRPIASCFDLIAGTSVGGIIALGLAAECPAEEIKAAFEKEGKSIFSSRAAPTTRFGQWRDFGRSLFSPKYTGTALRNVVGSIIGEETLIGDLKHPVVVPTVNLTKGTPQVFKTPHHLSFQRDHLLRVVDVAVATSAAPTYFPIAEIGDELFADGGLFANSPDMIALHEAEHFLKVKYQDICLLSIGTTTTQFSFSHRTGRKLGTAAWARRLASAMISSQQLDVHYMLSHKLADRYVRIDEVQSREQERDLGLDVATDTAMKTIRGLAAGSVQKFINNSKLQDMLRNSAPAPKFFYGRSAQ